MTDDEADVCGHPTAGGDGPPCQNPPGDNGRCHIPTHNDPDAENPQGRKFAIDESDHEDILEAASMGASKAGCARAAGVDKASLLRYLDAHEEFRTAFTQARATGEQRLLKGPLWNEEDAPREMDGQHARFLLSTSFGYKKTEKQEVEDVTEGGFGGGTEIVVTGEYDPNPDDGDE
jgi:hypothetical protein